jgi:hypothetical protein
MPSFDVTLGGRVSMRLPESCVLCMTLKGQFAALYVPVNSGYSGQPPNSSPSSHARVCAPCSAAMKLSCIPAVFIAVSAA